MKSFSLAAASEELLKALERTELTVSKCMSSRPIVKEMKAFDLYRKIRSGADFPAFHEFVARANRAKQKKFKEKVRLVLKRLVRK